MTRVLVTGATGFVGSHAAGLLAEEGHDVRCTVRASSDLRWLEDVDAERVEADLADGPGVARALEGVEAVAHLAGVTRARDDELFREVNVVGTRRLARAAARAGVRRFVFVSSLAARGPDGADGPRSAYGRSKREAEARLRDAAAEGRAASGGPAGGGPDSPAGHGPRRGGASGGEAAGAGGSSETEMEIVVLRPGGIYGPRDTDLLPLFRLADRGWFPVATPEGRVQPVFVGDVARSVLRALAAPSPGFGPWPVAERRRYRWPELARGMERALGRRVRVVRVPGAAFLAAGALAEAAARALGRTPAFDRRSARDLARHSWTCDPSSTEEALGWSPRVGLIEGLERTARWYRREGWL